MRTSSLDGKLTSAVQNLFSWASLRGETAATDQFRVSPRLQAAARDGARGQLVVDAIRR